MKQSNPYEVPRHYMGDHGKNFLKRSAVWVLTESDNCNLLCIILNHDMTAQEIEEEIIICPPTLDGGSYRYNWNWVTENWAPVQSFFKNHGQKPMNFPKEWFLRYFAPIEEIKKEKGHVKLYSFAKK